MNERKQIKYIHEGDYVAAVEVQLLESDNGWSPYLCLEDAFKLDDVREALRMQDLRAAIHQSNLFTMTPVTNKEFY